MKQLLSLVLLTALFSCNDDKNKTVSYTLNSITSVAEWKGTAPDHFHVGAFKVTGSIGSNTNGTIKDGAFIIPIASIENYDLQDPVKQQLLNHLKSPDFFNIALHPNAEFKITEIVSYTTADTSAIAGANYFLTGDFSMIGKTHSISFPAKITYTPDSLKAEAKFKIDRTKWGMKSYSDSSQKLYILPHIDIHLKIQAAKNSR